MVARKKSHPAIAALLLLLSVLCILPSACTRPPATDAARYAAALTSPDGYTRAADLCLAITDDALRGDCLVALMERWDHNDPAACTAIAAPLWRDECLFTLSERLWAAGQHPEGLALCHQTRFVRQCGYHLLQREVEAAADADEPPRTAEARLVPFAEHSTRAPDAPMHFWSLWFRRQAGQSRPVDEQDCAALEQPRPCLAGLDRYLHEVLTAQTGTRGDPCTVRLPDGWVQGPVLLASVTRWQQTRCFRSDEPKAGD